MRRHGEGGRPGTPPTAFARYLLPGIVFQSVLIGGAYATGREIVEYGARFGVAGLWSIAAIFVGFSTMCILSFEFARVFGVYDYRSFVRALIGGGWPLFDALFVVMAIIVIAVVGAASGSVVEEILGLPFWVGVGLVIVLVGLLNARGRKTIERFKTIGSILLYTGYVVFAGLVLARSGGSLAETLGGASGPQAGGGGAAGTGATGVGAGTALVTGILYVGYNLATLPATFFTLDTQSRRRHTIGSGLIAGVLATVPFVLTYLAIMSSFPDPTVLDAPVPWLVMLRRVGGDWLLYLYAVVILWTLIETSTGMIHAIVDRIAVNLKEHDLAPLYPGQVAALTVAVLLTAALLSRVGLIALVAQGYTMMAYGFLLLFALPLLTIGVARIMRGADAG